MYILFLNLIKKKRNVNVCIINVFGEYRKIFLICIFLLNFLYNNCIFYVLKSVVFFGNLLWEVVENVRLKIFLMI